MFAVHLQRLLRSSLFLSLSGAVFLTIFSFLLAVYCQAQELPSIKKHLSNGGYALNINNKTVYSQNLTAPFIPASTIKLITSLAALEILGPDYRFSTSIFLDSKNNLYIKGSGDPFLVSEKVREIAGMIAQENITGIRDIILDDSVFALETLETEGSGNSTKSYDARCGGLAVNFNTLPLQVLNKAKVKSPESQTPYLPIMGRIGKDLKTGYHRVNIDAFPDNGDLPNSLLYSGQLFQTLLEEAGIQVKGKIRHGQVPQNAVQVLTYFNQETISDLVRACLLSSSNFMANQLYLAIGVSEYGLPATWEKGQKAMNHFIVNELGLSEDQVTMVEGSGLSKNNRLSAEALILVLEKFKPHAALIPIKYGMRMKSGTLRKSNVFCYAGYITRGKTLNPFAILLNQKNNGRDRILKILYQQ